MSLSNMKECIRKWLEPLGLILLLVAFGWQCLAEHSKQVKYEGYIYEMSQKLDAIWLGVYDEALHSDRYHGEALVATNYDALNGLVRDWQQIQKSFGQLNAQGSLFFKIRVILYVLGSFLVIAAKWPRKKV